MCKDQSGKNHHPDDDDDDDDDADADDMVQLMAIRKHLGHTFFADLFLMGLFTY